MAQRSTGTPPLILIAETRPALAEGLRLVLADISGTRAVAVMAGLDHVAEYAEAHDVALIIVGQGLNGATPISEFRRLRIRNHSWRMALVADVIAPEAIMTGLTAGASGIIPASIDQHELHSAVTRILAGNIYIPNTAGAAPMQHPLWPSRVATPLARPALTPRQMEVLGVLAQGKSNKQIADILGISNSTVSMHLNAAYLALGVHDRTSAAMAFRRMVFRDREALYDRAG